MALLICLGTLAAFGILCAVWVCFGWLFSGGSRGCVICAGTEAAAICRRMLWLRDLGLVQCRVYLVRADAPEEVCRELERRGAVIWDLRIMSGDPEVEREEIG